MNYQRDEAWRRFQDRVHKSRGMGSKDRWKPEKKWKMIYIRSNKLHRAQQLGFDYPIKNTRKLLEEHCMIDG